MQEIAQDIIGFGNSFIWKGNLVKFETCTRILPYYIQKADFKQGKLSKLLMQSTWGSKEIDGKELVWLSNNHMGEDYLGVGVLQG